MPNATQTALVYIPVWIATGCWFLGVGCWLLDYRTSLRWSWMVGAIFLLVHIAASYAVIYHWDHAAAVEATRVQSRRVVGVDAG
jgi:hypothetical protein